MRKLLEGKTTEVGIDSEPPILVESEVIDKPEPKSKVVEDSEPEPEMEEQEPKVEESEVEENLMEIHVDFQWSLSWSLCHICNYILEIT